MTPALASMTPRSAPAVSEATSGPASPRRPPPNPPRYDLLPAAVRSAERLRGSLVRCGPGLRGVGWPETPRVRVTALAPWLVRGRIAVGITAAWVWGAAREPGRPLLVSVPQGFHRPRSPTPEVRVLALRIDEADTVVFGGLAVATPAFVVRELLHAPGRLDTAQRVACRLLVRMGEPSIEDLRSAISARRRPGRALALERLDALFGEG